MIRFTLAKLNFLLKKDLRNIVRIQPKEQQKKEYAFLGRNVEIEVMRTQYTTRVCHDVDQRGKAFSSESFPSKEYAQVIANN